VQDQLNYNKLEEIWHIQFFTSIFIKNTNIWPERWAGQPVMNIFLKIRFTNWLFKILSKKINTKILTITK